MVILIREVFRTSKLPIVTESSVTKNKNLHAFQLDNTNLFTFFPWLTNVSDSVTYCHSIKTKQKTQANIKNNITAINLPESKIKNKK